ncbi:hypothetical protein [Streptococcus caballi]|uniref:hypothetical protein n=1 Tax=Streptococcus caballi TaxID=439220 RepID=UPI000364FA3E|nr:hypothetical protein [Streptococcus caballi]
MTKSKARDAQLKARITRNKAKRDKYKRVKNSISNHSLNFQRSVSGVDSLIETCKDALDKLNGNAGYQSYLSNFQTKLTNDKKTLTEYRDFVKDANTSFINLYDTLEEKISVLDVLIDSDQAEFNEGHTPFVDEYYYWWD